MRVRSIRDVAAAARGRRKDLGLNQAELAGRLGVSRKWVSEFEGGKPKAEFALVLRLLGELGLNLDVNKGEKSSSTGGVNLDTVLDEHRNR